MKKLIIIILSLISIISYSQPTYTTINSKYNWLAGAFSALNVPAGNTVTRQTGQYVRSGALWYDSTGADSGLYVSHGNYWVLVGGGSGTVTGANNGVSLSGSNVQLGQTIAASGNPALISANREIPFSGGSYLDFIDGAGDNVRIVPAGAVQTFNPAGGGFVAYTNGTDAYPGLYHFFGTMSSGVLQSFSGTHWTPSDKHYDMIDLRGSLDRAEIQSFGVGMARFRTNGDISLGVMGTRRVGINTETPVHTLDVTGSFKFTDSAYFFSRIGATSDSVYTKRSDGTLGAVAQSSIVGSTPTFQQVLNQGGGGAELFQNTVLSNTGLYTFTVMDNADESILQLRAGDASGKFVLGNHVSEDLIRNNEGYMYIANGDSIVFSQGSEGIYSFRHIPYGSIDTSTYKPAAFTAAGRMVRMNSWAQVSGGGSGSGTVNSGTQYRIGYYVTTGTAISEAAAITAARALISDANGVPTHSSVTSTELGYVSGVTSAIQTQFGSKWDVAGNSVTYPGFIGSTNNQQLRFRTNNTQRFVLDSAKSRFFVGSTSGMTDASGADEGSFIKMTDNSNGGITLANNANNSTLLSLSANGIQSNQQVKFVSTGSGFYFNSSTGGSYFGGVGTATSTVHVNGSFATAYRAITALRTLDATDHTIEVTANTFTVTLPTAVGITGRTYVITNSGSGVLTLATTSSQTFVNVTATPTTLTLNQFATVTVQSNGANWLRITSL
jgi:hypothetical protein